MGPGPGHREIGPRGPPWAPPSSVGLRGAASSASFPQKLSVPHAAAGKRSWVCEELRVDGGTSKPRLSANPRAAARPPARAHRPLCLFHSETLSQPQRNQAQGCASAARNPKGPQLTPFCHQMGRHKRFGRGSDVKLDQNFAPDLSRGVPGVISHFC